MFGDNRPTGNYSRLCLAHDKFFQVYGLCLIRVPLTTEAIHAHKRSASWLWVGWCNVQCRDHGTTKRNALFCCQWNCPPPRKPHIIGL